MVLAPGRGACDRSLNQGRFGDPSAGSDPADNPVSTSRSRDRTTPMRTRTLEHPEGGLDRGTPGAGRTRSFEAEAKYEALLGQLPAAIYTDSPELDGPTFHMSPHVEELLGVPAQEFIDREDISGCADPSRRPRAIRLGLRVVPRTGQPEHGEYRYVRPDGHVVWVRDHAVMIRDAEGRRCSCRA